MNGVIYCRVSSKEQVEGTSLESQEVACREYASRNQISVVRVFVEQGESAKFADRTQLLELMEFCRHRENAVAKLLVWKVDRLARNVADHFNIKAELLKKGIDVVSATEPLDGNPEGKLLETILAGFAQFDNDLRAARTVSGMRRKIQEGIFPWKPPLGYRTRNQPGSKKTVPDDPDVPLFGLLQKAWSTYSTGAYTKAELIRLMTTWGIRTQSGKPVSKQTIDNMLRDSFYAGIIRDPWSGEEHTGRHIPLISLEIFAKIQEINNRRRKSRSVRHQREHPDFPLRAFARCAQCRHYLTGCRSRGRSRYYPYYRCSQRACSFGTSFQTGLVHDEFVSFLRSISPDREEILRLSENIVRSARQRTTERRAIHDRHKVEVERLKKRQEQLLQMRMDQIITSEQFLTYNSTISRRLIALTEKQDIPQDESRILDRIEEIVAPLTHLEEAWLSLPPGLKQRFQRMILPVGYVMGEIGTAEMSCFFSTFQRTRGRESTVVALGGQMLNQLCDNIQVLSDIFRTEAELQSPKAQAA
jgi:DNA invertase Pin-like site-specific DNA recombinase